jgi:hypothetical protein
MRKEIYEASSNSTVVRGTLLNKIEQFIYLFHERRRSERISIYTHVRIETNARK